MEHLLEEAFRITLVSEQNTQVMYHDAAAMLPEGDAKLVLQRLADRERKILAAILEKCPYPIEELLRQPETEPFPVHEDAAVVTQERRLLNLLRYALVDKHAAVRRYETFVQVFRNPEICDVFQFALEHSRALLRQIAHEYREADVRMQRPPVNRRVKRTHIRTGFGKNTPPNKHSQPFISMQDLGRRYPF